MKLKSEKMTLKYAMEILNWKYPAPYQLYNQEANEEEIGELLTNNYQAILTLEGYLIGFYCTGTSAQVPIGHKFDAYKDACLDIGLGMKPELTGKGFGTTFLTFIFSEIAEGNLRLTVATFNKRAVRLYEQFGFKQSAVFISRGTEFVVMMREKEVLKNDYY